ncbi:MAG: PLDc N-terminal domain-containing protein [Ilumatobacter sp.]|nr:PLDc N-terminal domain-containing protein [Ilumatobacter sp.]NKB39894.1 hypothetical protein [Ilumatobacter sp.]
MSEWVLLVIVALPLSAYWIRSVFEVIRRGDYSLTQRAAWLLILILLPIVGLAVYVVARTPRPVHLSGARGHPGQAEELVLLAEQRQRKELDDVGFYEATAALRPH